MRFGRTLRNSIYDPWKSNYIDYSKLKKLLREDSSGKGSPSRPDPEAHKWTEEDEGAFVEELVNVQLEKVNAFQVETYKQLRDRTSACEAKLEKHAAPGQEEGEEGQESETNVVKPEKQDELREVLEELDEITKETNELEKYSRINFTGFLKAAKKHDRKRGSNYRVRPLLQVRLAALPFNSEDYSPLLYRLSTMYSFIRENMEESGEKGLSTSEPKTGGDEYKSHKFWVHPENLLEVKTYILRRLPVLVYNPQTSRVVEGGQPDPTITSLYFDNPNFSLYNQKVDKTSDASSLRLRWFGQLNDKPEIFFEKKTIKENDESEEIRFPIKDKYVQPFIRGEYKMEKSVQKLRDREGEDSEGGVQLERNVEDIQNFIQRNELQPVLRANCKRTAFQVPGGDGVRISLDTELAFIREDALDVDRPCRDPEEWHRGDIDDAEMSYPFTSIRKGEIIRFPYALLEIKVRNGSNKKTNEWVADLMSSHLVKEAPRFSKFVHGVAQLFEDYVNSFPFWLSDLETDIRKDPEAAFQEEQERKAKQAEDEFAVGSLLGRKSVRSFKAAMASPVAKSPADFQDLDKGRIAKPQSARGTQSGVDDAVVEEDDSDDDGQQASRIKPGATPALLSILPSLSTSKYARARRQPVQLPTGVRDPGKLIKDSGPVHVEPKVWLANQRTFIKWQHISVLLASLSLGLYNAAGESNNVARGLAVVYTLVAAFAGAWGWWTYMQRSRMIEERSGKDFDSIVGPIVVCLGLVVALCLNFGFKYRAAMSKTDPQSVSNHTTDLTAQPYRIIDLPAWVAAEQDLR
ncbi:MAG: spx domain [Lasallia pustulata]|uniref:Spx domain n=1 Tax=Lasallia pustulata TaxID=136370 RepID=A0A5M8PN14_9LECA|nr:MAG: spx domain [Lasallia pustulata]